MQLPADIADRWQAANTELHHAQANHRRPGFSDELAELDDRLTAAHHQMADAYGQVAELAGLPNALVAAAGTAAAWHRDQATRSRRSQAASHA